MNQKMEYTTISLVLLSFALICIPILFVQLGRHAATRLPPGPYAIPVVGNIFKLGSKPHHSLANLSQTYGSLFSVKLGSTITIVASSPNIAKEFFHKHDQSFSTRFVPETCRMINLDKFSMVLLPAGDQWRRLRRICKEHLFSVQHLDASHLLREKKVKELMDHVHHCFSNGKALSIRRAVFTTTLNILSNFIFSADLAHHGSLESQEFEAVIRDFMEAMGNPSMVNLFLVLAPLDPQGIARRMNVSVEKLMGIFDGIINRRLQQRATIASDVLDLLLDLSEREESGFSQHYIRYLLFDLFVAVTDTTSSTVEWAMAELIHNTEKMAKARSEILEVIEMDDMIVLESDMSRLTYLQAIVKETLRLHPPAPLLLPHKAICDVEIQGYIVPKDAQVVCNVWSIGRDPSIWSNPQMFMPERFLDNGIDYKGRDFNLIPFGAGRRICPGMHLAHRILHLMLGSLIYKYGWKLEGDMRVEDIDMSEKFGLTLQKDVPLIMVPIKV